METNQQVFSEQGSAGADQARNYTTFRPLDAGTLSPRATTDGAGTPVESQIEVSNGSSVKININIIWSTFSLTSLGVALRPPAHDA